MNMSRQHWFMDVCLHTSHPLDLAFGTYYRAIYLKNRADGLHETEPWRHHSCYATWWWMDWFSKNNHCPFCHVEFMAFDDYNWKYTDRAYGVVGGHFESCKAARPWICAADLFPP